MSDLDVRLSDAELKAPEGQYRVVRGCRPESGPDDAVEYFLVEDFAKAHDALDRWRELLHDKRRGVRDDLRYTIYDDQGRQVDAGGTYVTEEERKAPPGLFRVISVDIISGTVRLVDDMDDMDAAIEYVKNAYEPYMGFQVHDDTGKALISVI